MINLYHHIYNHENKNLFVEIIHKIYLDARRKNRFVKFAQS